MLTDGRRNILVDMIHFKTLVEIVKELKEKAEFFSTKYQVEELL